ncbi:MAG TPA: hypothetical protein VGL02_20075 [Streptomyces sp.]
MEAIVSSILVPLRVTAPRDARLTASVEPGAAGAVAVARLRSTSHSVRRRHHDIASGDRDLMKAILHLGGDLAVAQDDRRDRLRPGELVLLDTSRPYTLTVSGHCDVVAIGVPRGLFGASVEPLRRRTAVPIALDSGNRRLIAGFLRSLGGHIPDLPGSIGRHIGTASRPWWRRRCSRRARSGSTWPVIRPTGSWPTPRPT